MTRKLKRENSEESKWVQFRGQQTSVVLDEYPLVFDMEERKYGDLTLRSHKPVPVVGDDGQMSMEEAQESDETAILDELAEQVVDSNSLVFFGVACELCEDVFDTPSGLSSHMRTHMKNDSEDDE